MSTWTALAPGKVNLCLFVGEPLNSGLHPIVSVIQPLSLADELVLQPASGSGDDVVCHGVEGPNLALRALSDYREATGWRGPPQRLEITKRVPVAAGMGGGSGDAAAALRLAAAAAGRPADPALMELAPGLGSDVAAALLARRCLVTGVGEQVESLTDPAPFAVLVLPSRERLSTPAVYAELDRGAGGRPPRELAEIERQLRAVAGSGPLPAELTVNDLEGPARRLCPAIDASLEAARATGADVALVSGSGPTVVGVFHGPDAMQRAGDAAAALRDERPDAVVAEPVSAAFAAPRPR